MKRQKGNGKQRIMDLLEIYEDQDLLNERIAVMENNTLTAGIF